jgi:hypothetical protein
LPAKEAWLGSHAELCTTIRPSSMQYLQKKHGSEAMLRSDPAQNSFVAALQKKHGSAAMLRPVDRT